MSYTLEQVMADKDNQRIMQSLVNRFTPILGWMDAEAGALEGAWKAVKRWNAFLPRGKFTSTLYRCVFWAMTRLCEYQNNHMFSYQRYPYDIASNENNDNRIYVEELMTRLPEDMRHIVEQHFIAGVPLNELAEANGCSRQEMYRRKDKAIDKLRHITRREVAA